MFEMMLREARSAEKRDSGEKPTFETTTVNTEVSNSIQIFEMHLSNDLYLICFFFSSLGYNFL
jgi:hypothetical protein